MKTAVKDATLSDTEAIYLASVILSCMEFVNLKSTSASPHSNFASEQNSQ